MVRKVPRPNGHFQDSKRPRMQPKHKPPQSGAEKPRLSLVSKICREFARPFRPRRKAKGRSVPSGRPLLVASAPASLANFDPRDCTVEPQGLELLKNLVRESSKFDGPIIEIGTLLGITATHMALA